MSKTYPIIGIKDGIGPDGSRPLRYELRKFVDPGHNKYAREQLNLFLLALERIQAMPREERLSWFQIGGIHGQPYITWDNSEGTVKPGPDQWMGYCTHSSILFPTWHRLYVALVEQAVHECMKQVLSEFPPDQQQELKPAVDNWRYPYWDWALAQAPNERIDIPELMTLPNVSVQRPNGIAEMIANPMYRYAFPMTNGEIPGITNKPYSIAPFTVRRPVPYDPALPLSVQKVWAQGISNDKALGEALNNGKGGKQLVANVYRLFAIMRRYPPFSNTGWTGSGNVEDYASLEAVHNTVHLIIGGPSPARGHMSLTTVAGFDPYFWMHHGNVERLFSIFQALNPEDYKQWPEDKWISGTEEPWFTGISQANAGGGTLTRPYGENERSTSQLTPFHKDDRGTVYNSDECRNVNQFGYAFEELQDWLPKYHETGRFNEPKFCHDIRAELVRLYGWAVPSLDTVRRIRQGIDRHHRLPEADRRTLPIAERQYEEYVVNVRVDRFANEGDTFVLYFFLGHAPESVSDWEAAKKAGMITIFGGSQFKEGACSNCAEQAQDERTRLVTGQFSLTPSLVELIEDKVEADGDVLLSLKKDEVGNFLKKNLHWRALAGENKEIDIHNIPSLKVSVAVTIVTLPVEEDEFLQYGGFEVLAVPTQGRLSGFDPVHDRL